MDLNFENAVFLTGTALTSGWIGTVLVQWLKGRSDRTAAQITAELGREGQLDDLTKELIASAKADIKDLREELSILRPLQTHLLHFEEAIFHLEAIVLASDPNALIDAKRSASAFLKRIDRSRRAVGNIRQETQILRSADQVARNRAEERQDGEE